MKVAFISSLNGGVGTFTVGFVKELSKFVERIDLYLLSTYKKRIRVPELPENVKIITTQRSAISLLIKLFFSINHLKKYDIIKVIKYLDDHNIKAIGEISLQDHKKNTYILVHLKKVYDWNLTRVRKYGHGIFGLHNIGWTNSWTI